MTLQPSKQAILNELHKLSKEYLSSIKKVAEIKETMHSIEDKIASLTSAYEILFGEKPSIETFINPDASLGNALESILRENKALEINRAIELLKEKSVRLSLKNPRNVLANLVKNDKRGRFTRLEDGRISLREK
ncbi:MAG: hypothetical protein ABSC53_06300 [Bacteroidota bacterium]|jgi:hypothetical protein